MLFILDMLYIIYGLLNALKQGLGMNGLLAYRDEA